MATIPLVPSFKSISNQNDVQQALSKDGWWLVAGGYDRQAITARGEWHRPLASHSGAAATGSVSGGAKEWRAITVIAATREPTQTLPMHFIKLVIRTIQLSTSLLCLDRMASLNRMIIIID